MRKSILSHFFADYCRNPIRNVKSSIKSFARNSLVLICNPTRKPGNEAAGEILYSLLCPTRNRPGHMARVWHSALDTADNPGQLEIIFYVDSDDLFGMRGIALAATRHAQQVRALIGPRIILSQCWNAACDIARGEILMHCGDDIMFRTHGWDSLVANKIFSFPDRIAFVYGRDGIQNEKLGTHGFIHRNWVNTVGYFVPPYFSSDYNDTWLHTVAETIGRKFYTPEVYIEHLHYSARKDIKDLTHHERLMRAEKDDVNAIWQRTAPERERDAKKLLEYIALSERLEGIRSST